MSLRARLLAGMAVVSFVLVAVAVIIFRTTEANLVDRVDQQLTAAGVVVGPGGGFEAYGGGPAPSTAAIGPSPVYVATIQDGVLTRRFQPNVTADTGYPLVSVDEAVAGARTGDAFTVPSSSGSGR
jgi:hypothetical protein